MKRFWAAGMLLLSANHAWSADGQSVSKTSVEQGIGVTLNFPRVYNLSYEHLTREEHWSWGIGAGYVPTIHFKSSTTDVGLSTAAVDVRGRWHPFGGGFFLGLGLGYANVTASSAQNINVSGQQVPTYVEVSVRNLFLMPHIGWIWTLGRVMLGLEFGSANGFGGSSTLNMSISDPALQSYLNQVQSTPEYQTFKRNVEDGFAKFGDSSLSYVAVRLGFTF